MHDELHEIERRKAVSVMGLHPHMASECWLSTRPEMIAKIFDLNDVIALPALRKSECDGDAQIFLHDR